MKNEISLNQPVAKILLDIFDWWAQELPKTCPSNDQHKNFPDDERAREWQNLGYRILDTLAYFVPTTDEERKLLSEILLRIVENEAWDSDYKVDVKNFEEPLGNIYLIAKQLAA
ncbi:MAG: hypothetical protein FWF23_03630 [Alphaproteobacteria bacterium]|nr:hypothetical protein [Alphaproteobacteria bacterium]MCL2505845.1 hypothetical protein [Alphaproteobacteria bacterium]